MKKYFVSLYAVCVILLPALSHAQEIIASSTDDLFIDPRVTVPTEERSYPSEPLARMQTVMSFTAAAPDTPTFVEHTIPLTPDNTQDIWTTSVFSHDGVQSGPGGGLNNDVLRVGGWGDRYHSLIQFDISTLPDTVESVSLQLYTLPQEGNGPVPMSLDRITQYWDWRTQGTGRDRDRLWWADRPTALALTDLSTPTTNSWYTIDITTIYRDWKAGTYPNYGIQLRPTQRTNVQNYWNVFASSDYITNPSLRPRLVITIIATPPTITLTGDATTTVEFGDTYTDPGATAHDDTDGDIAANIVTTGTVDTHHLGTTTLTYTVTNSAGLSASTTRTVIIVHTQFHPELDGYGFQNFHNTPLAISNKQEIFNIVFGAGTMGGLRQMVMNAWINSSVSDPFFGRVGNCFGMSLSAGKEFASTTQYFSEQNPIVLAQGPTMTTDAIGTAWVGGEYATNNTFQHIAHDQIAQIADVSEVSIDEFMNATNTSQFIINLKGWDTGAYMKGSVSEAHAVLPYRVEQRDNIYRVYVYDSNYPKDGNTAIVLTKNGSVWSGEYTIVQESTDSSPIVWHLSENDINIHSVSSYAYTPLHALSIKPRMYYQGNKDVLLQSANNFTGFIDGILHLDIPGITMSTVSGITLGSSSTPAYMFSGDINQDLSIYAGQGEFFKMLPDSYVNGTLGSDALVAISGDNHTITIGSSTGAYYFAVGTTDTDIDHTVNITGTSTASSTHSYTIDWTSASTPITEQIDTDGDGQIDETNKLDQNGVIVDTTPPEVQISFSTSTKAIQFIGIDDISTTTQETTAATTTITDASGNTLTLNVGRNITQPRYAALVMPSFSYSTGTTTSAITSLRYFWLTNALGKYTFFISAVKTPTDRQVAIYSALTNKTYVVAATPADDAADLSLQTALLLLRQKLKTYSGLYIPSVITSSGQVIIK